MAKLTIEQFCRRYDNENAHTEHVTTLALRLFDATRERLKLPVADRPILEAAGRLHDIAYSVDPSAHRETGAAIVLREGLDGFSDADRDLIAAVMLLHSGAIAALQRHRWIKRLPNRRRALRLGALLRVADGLDYGHQQDAVIESVEAGARTIRVTVCSGRFPRNIERADQKADLWWTVFPLGIELVAGAGGCDQQPGELRRGLHVLEAARRLLSLQFKTVLVNVDGARKGGSDEPLHDIRVAVRRARAVLRAFREPLAGTSAEKLSRVLQRLNRALGTARDADVLVAFLARDDVRQQLAKERGWAAFIRQQVRRQRQQLGGVRRELAERKLAALKLAMGRLLRIELPRLVKAAPSGSLEKLARRQFRNELGRAFALAPLRRSKSSDDLHRLRIALRRARYLGECFSALLGAKVAEQTARIHDAERALARIHDTDVGLQRLASGRLKPPASLLSLLQERRQKYLAKLDVLWRRLDRCARRAAQRA
jgi:CHAD domain-containing protein